MPAGTGATDPRRHGFCDGDGPTPRPYGSPSTPLSAAARSAGAMAGITRRPPAAAPVATTRSRARGRREAASLRPRRDRGHARPRWRAPRRTCAASRSTSAASTRSGAPSTPRPAGSASAPPRPTVRSPGRSATPSASRGTSARALGAQTPFPIIVPCHRSGLGERRPHRLLRPPGGLATKRRMLAAGGRAGLRPAVPLRLTLRVQVRGRELPAHRGWGIMSA